MSCNNYLILGEREKMTLCSIKFLKAQFFITFLLERELNAIIVWHHTEIIFLRGNVRNY